MNLDLIKILAIFLVTMCCIIATYTDVKRQIIPNQLTLPFIVLGISLVSFFYYQIGIFNIHYYLSVGIVFIISYCLWYFGVWAGGDVKLFTAISTLFIPEFLVIIPKVSLFNVVFPLNLSSCVIPTLLLMFNSVIAIIPVIIIFVFIRIIKDKRYLIDKLKKTINFNEVFLSLNSLIIAYIIISSFNLHNTIINWVLLIIISLLVSRIMKNDIILVTLTILIILQQLITANIFIYFQELVLVTLLSFIKNIYTSGIIKETLTDNIPKQQLDEGMILAYPLCKKNNRYYFKKTNFIEHLKEKINHDEIIASNQACGLTIDEISFIYQIGEVSSVPIKKGLSFAPFILIGLFLTLLFGNTFDLMILLMRLI